MSPDPKPIRAVTTTGGNPGTPPANPALLPLASLAEALQPLAWHGRGRRRALPGIAPLDLAPRKGRGPSPPQPRSTARARLFARELGPTVAAKSLAAPCGVGCNAPPPRCLGRDLADASLQAPPIDAFRGPTPSKEGPGPNLPV